MKITDVVVMQDKEPFIHLQLSLFLLLCSPKVSIHVVKLSQLPLCSAYVFSFWYQ